jgi:hypothetical protein
VTIHRTVRVLALLVGLSQALLGAGSLTGLNALVASHAHEVSLRADAGHVDLVLSHGAPPAAIELHGAGSHLHASAGPGGGHVVHLGASDATRDSLRRGSERLAVAASFAPLALRSPGLRDGPAVPSRISAHAPTQPLLVLRI